MVVAGAVDVGVKERIVDAVLFHGSERLVHGIEQSLFALRDNPRVHFFDKDFVQNAKRRIFSHERLGGLIIAQDRVNFPLLERLDGIGKFRVTVHVDFRSIAAEIRRVNIGGIADLHAHLLVAEIVDGVDFIGDYRLLAFARNQGERVKRDKDWEEDFSHHFHLSPKFSQPEKRCQ